MKRKQVRRQPKASATVEEIVSSSEPDRVPFIPMVQGGEAASLASFGDVHRVPRYGGVKPPPETSEEEE